MIRSKWNGLWRNDESHYAVSYPIDIDSLKEFVPEGQFRIIVKENKLYRQGTNRPRYVFAFGDSWSASDKTITSKDMQYDDLINKTTIADWFEAYLEEHDGDVTDLLEELTGERFYTEYEVRKCINGAAYDGARGYDGYDLLISDYV